MQERMLTPILPITRVNDYFFSLTVVIIFPLIMFIVSPLFWIFTMHLSVENTLASSKYFTTISKMASKYHHILIKQTFTFLKLVS